MERSFDWLSRDDWLALATNLSPHILAALGVFVGFYILLKVLQPALRAALKRADFSEDLIHLFVDGLVRGTILVVAAVMAAGQLGLDVAAAVAGIGVLGIAIGFAAQETIANMIAGFLIFWDHPFKIGDYLTTQGEYGEVTKITLRTTRILRLDHTYVVIPNKQVIGDLLVNHSMSDVIRVGVTVGIAYKESIAEARSVMVTAISSLPGVLTDPPPTVVAQELADSSVNLRARVWVNEAAVEEPTKYAMVEACKRALDDAGIEIPFPHMQLFVENVEDRVWDKAAKLRGGPG